MTADAAQRPAVRAAGRTGRGWARRYLPPQHGAWAMLLVPFGVGAALAGPTWVHLPLLLAWVGGYLFSYYAFLAVKTRQARRVRSRLRLYGAVTLPSALVVLVVRPELLVFAPAFAALVAVNAWYAWRRDERALLNDLASVTQGTLMVPVAAVAGGASVSSTWAAFVVVLLYFAGTVVYVKTTIRERGNASYLRASVAYHAVAALGASLVAWPLAVPFSWLLLRAAVLPHRSLTPKQVGIVEIGVCVVLLVMVPVLT